VLSAWPRQVQVYLRRNSAWVRVQNKPPVEIPYSQTLFPSRALELVSAEVPVRAKLNVTLSAAICPAVAFTVPEQVSRHSEIKELALAACAKELGLDMDNVLCAIDPFSPGIAAAMPKSFLHTINKWATGRHCRVRSMQPMWCQAVTQAIRKRGPIHTVLVEEADGVIALTRETEALYSYRVNELSLAGVSTGSQAASGASPNFIRVRFASRTLGGRTLRWPEYWEEAN
jgi:hypothetical protein